MCVSVMCACVHYVNEYQWGNCTHRMLTDVLNSCCIIEVENKKVESQVSTWNHGEILSSLNRSCSHIPPVIDYVSNPKINGVQI